MIAAASAATTEKLDLLDRCYALIQRNQKRYMARKISWDHYDIWEMRIRMAYGRQAIREDEKRARGGQ